jgi:hypothetical protein
LDLLAICRDSLHPGVAEDIEWCIAPKSTDFEHSLWSR